MLDFKTKARPCQIVPVKNEKNATFLAINHSLISFEKDTYKGNKKIPTRLTLIRALAPGWGSAPYKQSQKTARPQRLSEFTGGPIPAMRFYSFEKVANNSEKGPRCDDITFELHAGNALNFWLDEKRLGEIKDTIPNGLLQIPAFTVCEIEVAPKNNEAIAKGYGCTIKKIKPRDFTLYSCLQDIEAFPPSFIDASTALLKHQKAQTHLGNDLVTNEPSFFVHVADKAYLHEDPEQPAFVTLVNAGVDPVDIPLSTLLQYTNSTKKEQACSLLEMAIATGALQLFVIHNDYWKNATNSALRGIPILNTELLLQSVVPSRVGEQTCFHTPNTTVVEDVTYNIRIHVEAVRGLVYWGLGVAYDVRFGRNRSRSPTAFPRSRPTWCSRACRSSSSAPTRSASPSARPPARRSRGIGSATSTPRPARSPRPPASTSASSRRWTKMRRRRTRERADVGPRDGRPRGQGGGHGGTEAFCNEFLFPRIVYHVPAPKKAPQNAVQNSTMNG